MRYSLRTLLILVAVVPPILAAASLCGGCVTAFILDPLPYRGADPDFHANKAIGVNIARVTCPAILVAIILLIAWLSRSKSSATQS